MRMSWSFGAGGTKAETLSSLETAKGRVGQPGGEAVRDFLASQIEAMPDELDVRYEVTAFGHHQDDRGEMTIKVEYRSRGVPGGGL